MKASSTLIRLSLFSCNSSMVISQPRLKTPSTPVAPRASTKFGVSLKGTFSDTSKVRPCSRVTTSCRAQHRTTGHRGQLAYLFKQAVKVDMQCVPGRRIKEDVLAMSVAKSISTPMRFFSKLPRPSSLPEYPITYPRTKPTMLITARVRAYANLAANQAVGSGQVWKNHSWNTQG